MPQKLRTPEQAQRVAWRVIRDWTRAQLTMVEAGVVSIEEVMLPWAMTNNGITVANRLLFGGEGFLALPAPSQ